MPVVARDNGRRLAMAGLLLPPIRGTCAICACVAVRRD